MKEDEAIRQFLGDRPDAAQLHDWRATLEERLTALERDRKARGGGGPGTEAKVNQLKRQIAALVEEEAVTRFVEDSVRVTLAMGAVAEDPTDDPGYGAGPADRDRE